MNTLKSASTSLDPLAPLSSLDDQVYEALFDAIVTSKLEPGSQLSETPIANQLGVSKTPVRSALQRLEGELFIQRGPRNRYFVSSFCVQDIYNVYLVRSRLEGLAVALATEKITKEEIAQATSILDAAQEALDGDDVQQCVDLGRQFHELLLGKVENEFLSDSLRRLNAHIERGRRLAAVSYETSHHSVSEHLEILDAIRAGDKDLAEHRMQEHIMSFIAEIQQNE